MLSTQSNGPLWNISYRSSTAPILKGMKKNHIINLIGLLAIHGPSTTRALAKFSLKPFGDRLVDEELRPREQVYYKLIVGRRKSGGGWLPGLVSTGYITGVGKSSNAKNNIVNHYFLTLKGCLLALGYQFNDKDLNSFIIYASVYHLFFAYLRVILQKTSMRFVRLIFIEPIQKMIERGKISLDDDISEYFDFIATQIEKSLFENTQYNLDKHEKNPLHKSKYREFLNQVDTLAKNTWYVTNKREEWINNMIDLYYPTDLAQKFYHPYSEQPLDYRLLYKVMRAVHVTYYGFKGFIPLKHVQNLKLSQKKSGYKKLAFPPGKSFATAGEFRI